MADDTPEAALYAWLQNLPGLNNLVGGRIRTGAADVNDVRPLVVIEPPVLSPYQHTTGHAGMAESIIPIHCEGNSYKEARDISLLIFDQFKGGFHGQMHDTYVSHVVPTIRGKRPNVVGGNDQNFHSVEVQLQMVHEIPA